MLENIGGVGIIGDRLDLLAGIGSAFAQVKDHVIGTKHLTELVGEAVLGIFNACSFHNRF